MMRLSCLQANDQGSDQDEISKRGAALERALDANDLDSLEARQKVVQTALGSSGDPEDLLKRIRARFDRWALHQTVFSCRMLAFRLSRIHCARCALPRACRSAS